MKNILEIAKQLESVGPLARVVSGPNSIQHNLGSYGSFPDAFIHLHIELQTQLLAEILKELRGHISDSEEKQSE